MAALAIAASIAGARPVSAAPATEAPATPASDGWAATFDADVGTQLDDDSLRLLVVAAGSEAEPAAAALRRALVASGRTKLVMDGKPLGDVSTLDDAAIASKAKPQPVDRIVVVRVFAGTPASGVVTFYAKDGTVVTALAVREGVPMSTDVAAGSGVDPEAAKSVSEIASNHENAPPSAAEQTYDEQFLWFQNWIGVEAGTGRVLASGTIIKQGKYGRTLRRGELYKIVGRDDLLKKYRTRQAVRISVASGMFVAGIALLSAGAVALTRETTPDFGSDDPIDMGSDEPVGTKNGAWAMLGVGTALAATFWIPLLVKPHPIRVDQAAQLVDEYNTGLRKKLKLPKAQVGVGPTPSGGSFVLSGRF